MFDVSFEKLDDDCGEDEPLFSGYGRLTLTIGGEGIWCDHRVNGIVGIVGYWDGLLDHLARCWRYIKIEDPYPLDFNPESPLGFLEMAMAGLRDKGLSRDAIVQGEIQIFAFSDRHNLASGMPDLFLPPFFILREGNDMRIVTEMKDERIPWEHAMEQLEALGSAIAQAIHPQSHRGRMILEAWNQRNTALPVREALSLMVGTSPAMITEIAGNDEPSVVFGYSEGNAPSPMLLAARMTQHRLEPHEIRSVMDRVKRAESGKTTEVFANLRNKAHQQLEILANERHYRQGYELAKWLRSTLEVPGKQIVDPGAWLQKWGVIVESSGELPKDIDAVALWKGDSACIVFNQRSGDAVNNRRNRASLAHEMAHLLVDTHHALPAVEVLGGRMPILVEKRANAFAAELLLPRSQVEQEMQYPLNLKAITATMDSLVDQFTVSRQLTGHQMENFLKDEERLTHQV
ncbi:MAG: ImmA/IrrE family metallo-endopeptidase [Magnetococcus sp. WYHC-3]